MFVGLSICSIELGVHVKKSDPYLDYRRFLRFLIMLACISIMAGCSLFRPATHSQAWPEDIPDRAYFEAIYEADPANQELQSKQAYLTWVIRFYQGSAIYRRGWNHLVPDVVADIDEPKQRQALERQLQTIGRKIAADWAKDNNVRQITTAHLATWGEAMNESVLHNEQTELVRQIARDVDRLLQQQLKPQAIVANRYYPQDDDDVFR